MAMEEVTAAVELRASTLGDYADLRTRGASVFCLVCAGENFELLHRIQADGGELAAVAAGIDVTDAVEGEVVLTRARSVGRDRAEAATASRL